MKFSVKYRKNDGSTDKLVVEAESRSAVFKILAERGIKAIQIDQAPKRKGWNWPESNSTKQSAGASPTPLSMRALLAGGLVVALSLVCFYFITSSTTPSNEAEAPKEHKMTDATPSPRDRKPETKAEKIKQIKQELNESVKEFVKKADTNHVIRLGPAPLDPDDPDNALRTRTMTEVAMLVGIEPGEPLPPIPFMFMMEDAELEEAERNGERLVMFDGGNKRFLDELDKWKITIKETDSDQRAAKKQELLESQLELLQGIDEGMTVNDSIRAAYEFRKAAYEQRCDLIKVLSEMHEVDQDIETSKMLVDKTNEKLVADGIKKISYDEIIPNYEEDESETYDQMNGSME